MNGLGDDHRGLGKKIIQAVKHCRELEIQRAAVPRRLPVGQVVSGPVVKLATLCSDRNAMATAFPGANLLLPTMLTRSENGEKRTECPAPMSGGLESDGLESGSKMVYDLALVRLREYRDDEEDSFLPKIHDTVSAGIEFPERTHAR
jgi:hypothetical protein